MKNEFKVRRKNNPTPQNLQSKNCRLMQQRRFEKHYLALLLMQSRLIANANSGPGAEVIARYERRFKTQLSRLRLHCA